MRKSYFFCFFSTLCLNSFSFAMEGTEVTNRERQVDFTSPIQQEEKRCCRDFLKKGCAAARTCLKDPDMRACCGFVPGCLGSFLFMFCCMLKDKNL